MARNVNENRSQKIHKKGINKIQIELQVNENMKN